MQALVVSGRTELWTVEAEGQARGSRSAKVRRFAASNGGLRPLPDLRTYSDPAEER